MDCDMVLQAVTDYLKRQTYLVPSKTGCRIVLPFTEPNGDFITITVENNNAGQWKLHDGGHIAGLLFEVGPAGAKSSDYALMKSILKEAGIGFDPNEGNAYVVAELSQIGYWATVLATVMIEVDVRLPSRPLPRPKQQRLGPKLAGEVMKRLGAQDVLRVVTSGASVRGISDMTRKVDLRYVLPKTPDDNETEVLVLAVDLDVSDPVQKAFRSIDVVHDLAGLEDQRSIRLVYSKGEANGAAEPAEKLIRSAARKDLFVGFSWDRPEEQQEFFARTFQELSPLLNSAQ